MLYLIAWKLSLINWLIQRVIKQPYYRPSKPSRLSWQLRHLQTKRGNQLLQLKRLSLQKLRWKKKQQLQKEASLPQLRQKQSLQAQL